MPHFVTGFTITSHKSNLDESWDRKLQGDVEHCVVVSQWVTLIILDQFNDGWEIQRLNKSEHAVLMKDLYQLVAATFSVENKRTQNTSYRGDKTHKHTHTNTRCPPACCKHANTQTGLITIHCTAKLIAQYNKIQDSVPFCYWLTHVVLIYWPLNEGVYTSDVTILNITWKVNSKCSKPCYLSVNV